MKNRLMSLLLLSLASCFVGCGEGKPAHIPDLVPYSVKITHNGSPVDGAKVILSPASGTFSAAGDTDANGVAVLKTEGQYEGVVPGEYMVSVTKYEIIKTDFGPVPSDPKEYAEYERKLKAQPKPKNLLPEKFSSFSKSGLKASVSTGSKEPVEMPLE